MLSMTDELMNCRATNHGDPLFYSSFTIELTSHKISYLQECSPEFCSCSYCSKGESQVNVSKIVMKMSGSVILLVTGKILSKSKFILVSGFIKLSLGCRMLLSVAAGLCGASLYPLCL